MSKYKSGDVVRVRPIEWFVSHCTEDDSGAFINFKQNLDGRITSEMQSKCGEQVIIARENGSVIIDTEFYRIKDDNFVWADWMFEGEADRRYRKLRGLYEL